MTCAGFSICDANRAIAWIDSEVYADGVIAGHANKIAINAVGCFAAVGTGLMLRLREVHALVADCISFDEALARAPECLFRAGRNMRELDRAARDAAGWRIGVVGFSHGRILGAVLAAGDDFEARFPVRSFSAPEVELDVHDLDGAIAAGRAQLERMREGTPVATGGALVAAEITRGRIACGPAFDLRRGVALRRPAELETKR